MPALPLPHRRPGSHDEHFSAPVGGLQGAIGEAFLLRFPAPPARLAAVRVGLLPQGRIVSALQFEWELPDGTLAKLAIGHRRASWQPWLKPAPGVALTGFSGATGWQFDRLCLHFSDGTTTPLYGRAKGGDTEFALRLVPGSGRLTGLYGSVDEVGLETLGLIFRSLH